MHRANGANGANNVLAGMANLDRGVIAERGETDTMRHTEMTRG